MFQIDCDRAAENLRYRFSAFGDSCGQHD